MTTTKDQGTEKELIGLAGLTIDALIGLMKEFIRGSISNPILGVASAIFMSDILAHLGLLSKSGQTAVMVAVGALTAGAVAEDIASFLPFHQSAPDLTPSASTVVFADGNIPVKNSAVGDYAKVNK